MVWIGMLGFVLFLGFFIADMICISAIKKQSEIEIKSRIHRKVNNSEIIYANLGLVLFAVLVYLKYNIFVPAVLAFVLFVVLSTKIQSGLTKEGALVGTTFLEWEFIKGYKLVNDESDSNVIILKLRANHKQYVLVCDREDRVRIAEIMKTNHVRETEVMTAERM